MTQAYMIYPPTDWRTNEQTAQNSPTIIEQSIVLRVLSASVGSVFKLHGILRIHILRYM